MARPPDPSIEEKRRWAWEHGVTEWVLDRNQRSLNEHFKKCGANGLFVANCSRQIGKSFWLVWLADWTARNHPGAEIKYAAPTAKMVRKIIRPHFRKLLKTCPEEMRPKWHAADCEYRYPNGSVITIAGVDRDNVENLRGQHAHLAICDEAGFMADLKYVLDDVLMPQTLNTDGRIIVASTPAKTPGHYFKELCDTAEAEGMLAHRTIYDNPRMTPERIERVKKRAGGEESTTWKREYLALHVTDESTAGFPEASALVVLEGEKVPRARVDTLVTADYLPPRFRDWYTVLDLGFSPDPCGLLIAWWWFEEAALVIEDELLLKQATTRTIANAVRMLEKKHITDKGCPIVGPGQEGPRLFRYMDMADGGNRLAADLAQDRGEDGKQEPIRFSGTRKDNKDAAINTVRLMILCQKGRIIINPRCTATPRQLKNATWNKQRTEWERTERDGHYELADDMTYLCRNLQRQRNPVPLASLYVPGRREYIRPPGETTSKAIELAKVLGIRR